MPCYYCGKSLKRKRTTIDHVRPVARGGTSDPRNLVDACHRCNTFLADWPERAKRGFRRLFREHGWKGMPRRFGQIDRAATRLLCEEAAPDAPEPEARKGGREPSDFLGEVRINFAAYRAAVGEVPRGRKAAEWRFRYLPSGVVLSFDGRFSWACNRARRSARRRREPDVELLPPRQR